MNGKNKGFCVKMVRAGHLHAARSGAEGTILDNLEFRNGGRRGIGKPDGGSVGEKGLNEGLESYQ